MSHQEDIFLGGTAGQGLLRAHRCFVALQWCLPWETHLVLGTWATNDSSQPGSQSMLSAVSLGHHLLVYDS